VKLSRKPIRVVNSCLAQAGLAFTLPAEPIDKVNGPITECVQHVCDDTLPWLISFPLGNMRWSYL